jgi:hypothetical protein
MLRDLRLGTKFTLLLLVVFLGGTIVSAAVLFQIAQHRAQEEVVTEGRLLMETMNAVRAYTSAHVNPLLAPALETQSEFIPATVPAFSAREVFENFRRQPEMQNFLYKEATLNPTNPRDLADDFERAIVERFRADPALKEQWGYRQVGGEDVFYSARPLVVASETCLRCHSDPALAPASLITTYGTENGFGWQLNDVVAAQMIYVPAADVFEATRRSLALVMLAFVGVFILAILAINALLRRAVVRPIGLLAALANKVTNYEMGDSQEAAFGVASINSVARRGDELGQSARAFQKMAREVYAREQKLLQQVQELRIEIDEARKVSQIAEITDTDYFRDLQKRAREMRRARVEEVPR